MPDGAVQVKLSGLPEHTGELLPATATGFGRTSTTVVALLVQGMPPRLTVTVYVPNAVSGTFGIIGFCIVDVNPDGPVQLYVTPGVTHVEYSLSVSSVSHTGVLLVHVGVAGVESMTTFMVLLSTHPLKVAMTVYTPEKCVGAPTLVGSESVDEKPAGPVHTHVSPTESGLEYKISVFCEHNGALKVAVISGFGFKSTCVLSVSATPPIVFIT